MPRDRASASTVSAFGTQPVIDAAGHWDRLAESYERLASGWPLGPGRRKAMAWLAAQPGERILLSGCGPGFEFTQVPAGVTAYGADLARGMVTRAARRAGCRAVLVADAQRLPFAAGSFDGVVLNLICAVAPDGAAVLSEAVRVTRAGGRIVIFDKLRVGPDRWWRRRLTSFSERVGSDFNRAAEAVFAGLGEAAISRHAPASLGGFFRVWRVDVGPGPRPSIGA